MSDMVERAMEETALLMRQVRKARLMDDNEIVDVTRRRRDHEYRLRARGVPRSAFLEYAEFERELASLLRARSKKRNLKRRRADGIVFQARSRVNLVYSRAVKRFKGDVQLWLHYARHCVDTGTNRTAARVLARAIAMRPDSPDVWLAAVAFHFDTMGDVTGARKIAQRALRTIPQAKPLWLHYFRLELAYLCKVIARRVAMRMTVPGAEKSADIQSEGAEEKADELAEYDVLLQKSSAPAAADAASDSEIGTDVDDAMEDKTMDAEGANATKLMDVDSDFVSESESGSESEPEAVELDNNDASEVVSMPLKFWQGGVPIAVFRQAKLKIDFKEADLVDFWRITSQIPFVPALLIEQIVSDIESSVDSSLVIRCIAARLAFDVADAKLQHIAPPEALKLKENTMSAVQDNTAYDAALAHVKSMASSAHASLLDVLRDVEKPILAETTAALPIVTNFLERAQRYIGEDMVTVLSDELVILQRRQQKVDLGVDLTELTLESVVATGSFAAWKKFLSDSAEASADRKSEIRKVLKETIAIPFRNAEKDRVAALWVRWEDELDCLISAIDALLHLPPMSKLVLLAAAEALKGFLKAMKSRQERADIIARLREVFGKLTVLRDCKNDVDLWIEYVEFERDLCGDVTRSSAVIWKAKKTLSESNAELFTEKLCIRSVAK